MDLRKIVTENPILAVLRKVPFAHTIPMAGAILSGGVSFFEVALNSERALEQISLLQSEFSGRAWIGAGTVRTAAMAAEAVRAGAQFLLTPCADEEVLAYCQENQIPLLPGALTPTEISACLRHGFSTIKLFPADAMPKGYVKNLKGPLDGTEYVAMGGVKAQNLLSFFQQGYLGVGMGSSLLPKEAAAAGDWEACAGHVASMLAQIQAWKGQK